MSSNPWLTHFKQSLWPVVCQLNPINISCHTGRYRKISSMHSRGWGVGGSFQPVWPDVFGLYTNTPTRTSCQGRGGSCSHVLGYLRNHWCMDAAIFTSLIVSWSWKTLPTSKAVAGTNREAGFHGNAARFPLTQTWPTPQQTPCPSLSLSLSATRTTRDLLQCRGHFVSGVGVAVHRVKK